MAVPWEVLQEGSFFVGFPASHSFVSHGRCGTSRLDALDNVSKVVLRGRHSAFATLSEDALHFAWPAQHCGRLHVYIAWHAQHFRRVVLRVFLQIAAKRGDQLQIPWQA